MKKMTLNVYLIALFISFGSYMQVFGQEIGTIEYTSKKLSRLIKKDARIEVLAEGFKFTEGPLWLEKEHMLLFSDVPANAIYKWTEAGARKFTWSLPVIQAPNPGEDSWAPMDSG